MGAAEGKIWPRARNALALILNNSSHEPYYEVFISSVAGMKVLMLLTERVGWTNLPAMEERMKNERKREKDMDG